MKPVAIRDDLLVKVPAPDAADPSDIRAAIAERLDWSRSKLAHYEERLRPLLDGRTRCARRGGLAGRTRGLTWLDEC